MDESARIVMCIGDIIIKREPDEEEEDKKCEATQQSESESRKADVDDSNSTFETGNSSYSVIKTETTEKDHGNQMNICTSGNVPPGTCTTGNLPPGTCIYPAKNVPPGTCIYPAKIVPTSSCIHQAKKIPGQLNKQNTIKDQNYTVMRQLLAWGSNNRMRGKYKPDDINDMLHDSSKGTNKQSPIVTTLADVVNVKPLIVVDPGKDYDYNCIECGKMLNPPYHQCLWQCKKCSFASVCMISFKAHYNRRHNGTLGPLNKVNQPCIKDMPVDNNLLFCICAKCKSFHSCNPKEMGDHLNKCAMKGNKSCFTVKVFDKTDSTHSAATTQIAPPNPVSDPVPPLQNVDSQESPLQASNSTLNGMLNDEYSASKILQKMLTEARHAESKNSSTASNSTLNGMLNDGYSASKILQKMLIEARHAESKNSSTAQEKIPSAQQSINSKENLALLKSKFHGLSNTPHQDISRDGQDSVRSTEPREKLTSIASYLNTAERFTNVVNVMHQEPGLQSQKVPGVSNEAPVPRLLLANNDGRTAVLPQEDFTSENFLPHSEFNNSVPTEFKPSITPGNSDVLNQNVLPHFNIENSVPTEFKPSVMPGNSDVLNHLPQNPTQGTAPRCTLNNAPNTLETVPHVPGLSTEPSIVMINGIPHKLYIYNPQGADQNTSQMSTVYSTASHLNASNTSPMSTVYSTVSHLNSSNTYSHGQSFGASETDFTSLLDNNSLYSSMPQHLNTSRANPVEENMATSSFAQVKVESTDASENIHFSAGPVKTESTDASENIHFSSGPVKNERIPVPTDENVQFGTTSENNIGFQFRHVSQGLAKPTGTANYQNINNQPVSIVKFVQQQNTLQMQGIMEQTNVNNSQQLLQGAALSQMITPVLEMKDGKVQLKLCLRQPNQIAGGQIQSLHNNFVSLPLKSVNERDQHQTMQNTTQTSNLAEVTVLPDMLNHKKRKRKDTHLESEEFSLMKRPAAAVTNLIEKPADVLPETKVTKVIQKTAEVLPETKEFGLTKKQAIAVICQIMNTAEDLSKTGGQKKFDTYFGVPFKIRSLTITDSIPVLASGMLACRICPKQFWHLDSLLQHHDMELPEKRTDCGHVMSQLDCHVCLSRIDNWISATDSIICFCETCDKTYTSLLQFNHHVILLHGEQKQCTFCKKDFFRKREFRDHVCERLKKLNYSYKMDKFAFCYKMDVPLLQKLAKRKKLNVQKVKGCSDTNNGIISNNYEAEGDNCTHKLAENDNTHYLAEGSNGTCYLAEGGNGKQYLAEGGNRTHYLAGGDNGTHYLAGGDNGTHYLAGKKRRVNTKDSATKIVKTPSELFMSSYTLTDSESEKETYIVRRINNEAEAVTRINTKAEIVTKSNTEAEMVANSNTETEMITNSNTETLMVANSNTEAEMVTRIKSEAEMVTNSNTEAVMLTNSNTEAVMVANSNTEAVMVANSNTEAVMVADSKTEAEMVTNSNTEAEMVTRIKSEAEMVTNSNTKAVMVTNSNTEAEMVTDGNTEAEINTDSNTETEIVANSNTEAEMVTRIKTEAEMINYSNTEAEIVTNSNTEAEMITNCNTEAEMVTRIKTEADIVTYSDAEAEIVANSNTEADIVFRSNTVPENFESHTQNNEIQLQDSLVKDQIKTTHVNCFCSPCKVLFTSLKKFNAHAWFVHTQRQCVICHTYFTNHLCMCNHECARVILQMKINPMTQIVVHFESEDKILEKVRGHGNQWYVFVKDNPMTLEETKTKDLRLPCYCRTCKIGLISLSQLNNHIYDVHTTRAECIYCKMDFNSTEEMGDHFCEKLKTKLKENILTEITACPCLETYDKYSRRGVEMITLPWLRMSAKTLRELAQEKLDKVGKRLFVKKTDEQKKEILNEILTKKKKKLFSCFENSNRVQFVKMKREQFVKKNCPVCSRIFFGTSDQSLYEHFYKKHQKDTKYCRFCQQAFFADNHECKKEKEESYMKRKENKDKIKEELVGEESIKLQKCPQCSYIKNFCKENIHNQTCTRKACLSCENYRECEGKNCFYCGKIFHFESLTWRHVEKKHRSTKTGIFHCYLCNITINTLEQLQLHVKTVHPLVDALSIYRKKTKYRQCRRKKKSIEQRLADAKKQRKKYQEKHKDRYKCEVCQEKFTYYIMLRKHIANEHERETFGCNICNMQFKHKKTLERHQMKGHLQVCEKEKPKHTCFVCDKKYSTPRSLRRHNFKEHLIEDKHISKLRENVACEQCGKVVMRKCMRLHLLVHQEKEFMCEDCGEKFRRPDDLKRHRQKHLRKKYVLKSETSGYKCLICGLILSTNGAIKRHFSLKHSSEKIAIPCKICGRLYASKPVLDIHMKLKHSEKSFQCEICNKKFYYNYLLKNHVKIVHENYKPFQCDICNFRCYMKSALVSHMKYNH